MCIYTSSFQEGNPKGIGAGSAHVPKDEPTGKKTGLAEQRALAGIQGGKKGKFITFGRKGEPLVGATRMPWLYAGRKLEGLKPNQN